MATENFALDAMLEEIARMGTEAALEVERAEEE
jgi:hypothetical protein